MRDRATSSAAGAGGGGGGAGGRDPDDAWREEHAVAWGQSTVERAALRSQYAAVRGTIRELKDDPALGKFDAAVDRIEMLHDKVQRSLEQLADGEALLDLADVLVSSTKAENRDGPTPSEFVTALLRKFGVTDTPLDSSNESFSWSSLGGAVSALFMTATGCQTMNGPMDLAIKERSCVVRKQSESLGSRPAEPDELPPDQDERNDTDENLAVMFRLLIRHKSVKLEHLILNWRSFAQTVDNIFALSFLVKDGRAEINVVDNGDHFVAPRNAPTAGSIASRKVTNNQFVFRFDTKDWEIMKYMVKPGEQLMPHRSSYCGGEYKNTQSYPGRSKLGSDSEHLKQDEFAKEEAMKENLADRCSGDDTLKKRKRQHVARRLFSADD
ncbi:non-structural maintenance of chromosomes element 4 homolog B isoform X1 [Setaria viridis]|uniref:non-structural maintenance of chromosomes element 4 homolog B isoform X1 n=1 Tax=Setaria viridis TaxID=4556 RepID=UPI0014938DF2|nr:non-structural maintenance of chromosomes element 4 homolog B-like isoform X1 [Setaria viridis]